MQRWRIADSLLGGWSNVVLGQLYHDRDEVTVRAVRRHA
jgi:23S rRNA C2498 (ribose-2'-O)-methylase RlmM